MNGIVSLDVEFAAKDTVPAMEFCIFLLILNFVRVFSEFLNGFLCHNSCTIVPDIGEPISWKDLLYEFSELLITPCSPLFTEPERSNVFNPLPSGNVSGIVPLNWFLPRSSTTIEPSFIKQDESSSVLSSGSVSITLNCIFPLKKLEESDNTLSFGSLKKDFGMDPFRWLLLKSSVSNWEADALANSVTWASKRLSLRIHSVGILGSHHSDPDYLTGPDDVEFVPVKLLLEILPADYIH
nr:hypothetical protein Itr_chr05CG09690 [Ipomoea trifida]